MIPREEWEWFGHAGHFICGHNCRFHLCTKVGDHLVSTVGEYVSPAEPNKTEFQEIGLGRTYETMVFRAGDPCSADGCNCGLPDIDGRDLDTNGYNDAGSATIGHYLMCEKWANGGDA